MKYDFDTPAEKVILKTPVYNIFLNSIINNGRQVLESSLRYGDKAGGLYRLEAQRVELLDEIHKEQSCIEFLDELLCNLRG